MKEDFEAANAATEEIAAFLWQATLKFGLDVTNGPAANLHRLCSYASDQMREALLPREEPGLWNDSTIEKLLPPLQKVLRDIRALDRANSTVHAYEIVIQEAEEPIGNLASTLQGLNYKYPSYARAALEKLSDRERAKALEDEVHRKLAAAKKINDDLTKELIAQREMLDKQFNFLMRPSE